jgi:hypothetical protein
VTKYRWEIVFLPYAVLKLDTEDPEPPTDVQVFTVTDQLGRRHTLCWYNIASITIEQIQEQPGAPAPS